MDIPIKDQGIIYKLTFPSGKSYIGQVVEYLSNGDKKGLKGRLKQHITTATNTDKNFPIYRAIRKYGAENIIPSILIRTDKKFLNMYEELCIKIQNTLVPLGYNVQKGGYNIHTEETRRKMSDTMTKKLADPEMRKKWSQIKEGKHQEGVRVKKCSKNEGLPKYIYRKGNGYVVEYYYLKTKTRIYKSFTKKKFTLNENFNMALEFLMKLHIQYDTSMEWGSPPEFIFVDEPIYYHMPKSAKL